MSQNDPAGLAHAKKLIEENLKTKATFLDLGNCGLKDLGELPELLKRKYLRGLNLGSWYWHNQEFIKSKNPFEINIIGYEGAKAIGKNLRQLTSLSLWENEIGDEGAKVIAENLGQLTSLSLGTNKIGDIGANAIGENLKQLTSLALGANKIGDVEQRL